MSPLRLLRLLACVAAACGALYQRQLPDGATPGSELAQLATDRAMLCGMHCQLAGSACVGFHHSGATCHLFSALYPALEGTFVRQLRPPPAGYSACGRTAYRVYLPMSRDEAEADCAAAGSEMAVPITAEERACVQTLVTEANALPGFKPPNLNFPNGAHIGILVHGPGPDYTITDLENNPLELPADVWKKGQPNGDRQLAYGMFLNGRYHDSSTDVMLKNVCEVGLFE